jgi:hypothetical protein
MKVLKAVLAMFIASIVWMACSDSKDRYVDLSDGQPVQLVKNDSTGLMVNAETHKPVRIYVDTKTHDTIWGKTGKVVNGSIRKSDNGGYIYIGTDNDENDSKVKRDDEGSYKIKDDDANYKKKVEKDGDIKIKTGDKKIKIDGETGERKGKKY